MRLVKIRVLNFRNILDSTPINIDPEVTCLVGKNESGKTALLEALYRLRPARPNVCFSVHDQYPAWLEKQHRLQGQDLEAFTPVTATFDLSEQDLAVLAGRFGKGAVKSKTLTVSRKYDGTTIFDFEVDEEKAVRSTVKSTPDLPGKYAKEALKAKSFAELTEIIAELETQEGEDATASAQALSSHAKEVLGSKNLTEAVIDVLDAITPRFFYFDSYSRLPGTINIRELLNATPANLDDDELTALTLLKLAAFDEEFLLNPDYERRKRELENIANALTKEVLDYWSQNPELRVLMDLTMKQAGNAQPPVVVHELHIRMWDDRHSLSLPFEERSSGFQWFFSFLAAFSEYQYREDPMIILLDEPALGLHARAQKDFLRYIDERLAPKHQVVFTTHSPFMVQPGKLERVRVVEDHGVDEGAVVSDQVMTTDPDTLFPLQGALGYDMAQHLFLAPDNLVVEGTSDFTYLAVISDFLRSQGRHHLHERWSIVPVGGADLIPTFVALLGPHLDVTVLVDSQRAGHQKLQNLADAGYLENKRIVTVGEVLGRKTADIEDLFDPADYLQLFNKALGKRVNLDDLTGSDPIVARIARHQKKDRFDHGVPADYLLHNRPEVLSLFSDVTLGQFEKLFERINDTLS